MDLLLSYNIPVLRRLRWLWVEQISKWFEKEEEDDLNGTTKGV
jgi:hypothetical protein